MAEGIKKEFVIDSSDSAKPPVTLQDEPRYFSDIKPKKRVLADIIYEETGEVAKTRKGKAVTLILKSSVYNDGCVVTTTVGEENEAYQEFKRSGVGMPSQSKETTAVRKPSAAVQKAIDAGRKAATKVPAKPSKSKE